MNETPNKLGIANAPSHCVPEYTENVHCCTVGDAEGETEGDVEGEVDDDTEGEAEGDTEGEAEVGEAVGKQLGSLR